MGNHYDIIIIGSGMGALTVASLMAQLRFKRVLVLERHFRAGGYTHDFKRKGYHFDTGVHYLAGMEKGAQARTIFDLITSNQVDWQTMPDPHEVFVYPEVRLQVSKNVEGFIEALNLIFPKEKAAIQQYFKDIRKAALTLKTAAMSKNASLFIKPFANLHQLINKSNTRQTTKEYLDQNFKNPQLKALLVSQWGDYGLPPGKSPFMLHALIAEYYLEGGFYPVGGSGKIAESVQAIVESSGGKFLTGREVDEILIQKGRAIGVRTHKTKDMSDPEDYFAPVIVSNAGAAATYLNLIPETEPIPFRKSLSKFLEANPPTSNLTLFAGLSEDPGIFGFKGENHWLYANTDHDRIFEEKGNWVRTSGKPEHSVLTFPSKKDPESKKHTLEVLSFTDFAPFSQWQNQPWKNRDDQYIELKEQITDSLISFIKRFYPKLVDLIDYKELGTPLSNQYFTGHDRGAAYGLSSVIERFLPENRAWTHPKTPIPGLYLTGADVAMSGVFGALLGGLLCIGHLPGGPSTISIFSKAARMASR